LEESVARRTESKSAVLAGTGTPIEAVIYVVRGRKVILDADLGKLYGVETKALNRALMRNRKRFPHDFVFQLNRGELDRLRCQFGTSNDRSRRARGGRRYLPYVFTEHGAIMAAGILNSDRAVAVSVAVVRAFIRLRKAVISHADLRERLDELEARYDAQFKGVFDAIRRLMEPPARASRRIGFRPEMRSAVDQA
jgi:hypothetical protein